MPERSASSASSWLQSATRRWFPTARFSFHHNLLGGRLPILEYYLWQAGVGAINALIVVAAADDNAEERAAPGWVYGTLNLVLVSSWMIVHLVLASGTQACTRDGTILLDAFAGGGCFRRYNLTDFFVYAVLATLAAGAFARPRREGTAPEVPLAGSGRRGGAARGSARVPGLAAAEQALTSAAPHASEKRSPSIPTTLS